MSTKARLSVKSLYAQTTRECARPGCRNDAFSGGKLCLVDRNMGLIMREPDEPRHDVERYLPDDVRDPGHPKRGE